MGCEHGAGVLPCGDYGQRLASLEAYQRDIQQDLSEIRIQVKEGFMLLNETLERQRSYINKMSIAMALLCGSGGGFIGKYLF